MAMAAVNGRPRGGKAGPSGLFSFQEVDSHPRRLRERGSSETGALPVGGSQGRPQVEDLREMHTPGAGESETEGLKASCMSSSPPLPIGLAPHLPAVGLCAFTCGPAHPFLPHLHMGPAVKAS